MTSLKSWLVPVLALVFGTALAAAAQTPPAEGARRGPGGDRARGTLLGLLKLEQVQKELKLTEELLGKVKKVDEEITAEMTKESAALREIEDRDQRRAKMTELADKLDAKSAEKLGDVLSKEQMTRLQEVRMQVRSVVDSLGNKAVAEKLKVTEEQKTKLAEINKDLQAKRTELFAGMRDATEEQRAEAMKKFRKVRSDADEKALALLTPEQKKAFEDMRGKKFELEAAPAPRPPA
jgi:Spy/CpxP family protein refolding chaperone